MVDFVDLKELLPSLKETLEAEGKVKLTVAGNSMLPMLKHHSDSVTLVKPKLPIKKYSVALFVREDGAPVLHRVVGYKNGEYKMRGDNCAYSEKISPPQILAVVETFTHNEKDKSVDEITHKIYAFLWCNEFCFFIRKKLLPKVKSLAKKIFKK